MQYFEKLALYQVVFSYNFHTKKANFTFFTRLLSSENECKKTSVENGFQSHSLTSLVITLKEMHLGYVRNGNVIK